MNRIYLDYNATSPLAPSVTRWLTKGDFFWANPASQHSSGKHARARLDDVIQYLHSTFKLSPKSFNIVFHSGATEGVNAWVEGMASQEKVLFVYSPLDHACVRSQRARLEKNGHACLELPIDKNGDLRVEEAIKAINKTQATRVLLNWTWVQNETGVVWPLSDAVKIKEQTGAFVHVDAVQAPGKVTDWKNLADSLDAYTFSAHKFGGLKGIGWSFTSKKTRLDPLILGGGQQEGSRSGTENVLGAWALKLALEELDQAFNASAAETVIQDLRLHVDQCLKGKGHRVAQASKHLNLNTILFVLDALPADLSLPLFDLAGLELSAGSACASGTAKPSPVLEALGEQSLARHGLRLSLDWAFLPQELAVLKARLAQVFEKVPKSLS